MRNAANAGYAGSIADDFVKFNGTVIAGAEGGCSPDTNCPNLPTAFTYDVTSLWLTNSSNTIELWDGGCCGGNDNNAYLAPFQIVHVLQPPVVTISFSKATDCAGWDNWTGMYGPVSLRDLQGWVAVPRQGTNTVTATISPSSSLINVLRFESEAIAIATVSPTTPTTAAQELTVTGVAAGEVSIHAKIGAVTLASFHADVLPPKTNITVALFSITDSLNTNTQPQYVPTATELENHLNLVYGQQANVWFTVAPAVVTNLHYDVWFTNGLMELREGFGRFSPEAQIVQTNTSTTAKIKVYHVRFLRDRYQINGLIGGEGFFDSKEAFVADAVTCCTRSYIATHEIGHALADLDDVPSTIPNAELRLMYEYRSTNEPCRLIRNEWRKINEAIPTPP